MIGDPWLSIDLQFLLTVAKDMILGGVDVSGEVRGSADYSGNYRTTIGGNDRQFCYYTS